MSSEILAWTLTAIFLTLWLKAAWQRFFLKRALREGALPMVEHAVANIPGLTEADKLEFEVNLERLRTMLR